MRTPSSRWSQVQAVVLGGDIGSYSIARAFYEETGRQPVIISAFGGGVVRDSTISRLIVEPEMEQREVLAQRLHTLDAEFTDASHVICLASADWNVQMLVQLRDELPTRWIVPYPQWHDIEAVTDKAAFSALCAELNIPHPRSIVRQAGQDFDDSALTYPLVGKAVDTPAYHRVEFSGKKKVFTFPDPAATRAALQGADEAGYTGDFLLQEYIPGADSQMRVANLYAQDGRVVFAGMGRVLLEEHAPSAIGNSAAIITEVDEELIGHARRILEHVGWHGFACFDVKVDPRTGQALIFEMNARLGRAHHYLTAAGANPARYYLRDWVDGKTLTGMDVLSEEWLYTVVPISLLTLYTPGQRARIAQLVAQGKVGGPLLNRDERSPKRWGYIAAAYANQWRKFMRFHPPSRRQQPGL